MRIEDVQGIATRVEQLLRLTVNREFGIHAEDGGGFVPTVTVEEQGADQFVAEATIMKSDNPLAEVARPGAVIRAIGFTRYEAIGALAHAIRQRLDELKVSHRGTAASCQDLSARMRLAAASRRAKIATASIALGKADPKESLARLAVDLGYECVKFAVWRRGENGSWKAVAEGRGVYCEAHSDTTPRDAMLALAASFTTKVMEECEVQERSAMKADRKAMAYALLADHFAAEAAMVLNTIREAAQR